MQSVHARISARVNPERAVRKDAVLLCEATVNVDMRENSDVGSRQALALLESAAAFLHQRYQRPNCMYSTIHLKETSAHLHFGFVPMTVEGRLSAKRLINRMELQRLQKELPAWLRAKGFTIENSEGEEDPSAGDQAESCKPVPKRPETAASLPAPHGYLKRSGENGDLSRENQTLKLENLLLERQLKNVIETIKADPQLELLYLRQIEMQAQLKRELHRMNALIGP